MRRKTWKNESCEKKIWKNEALKKLGKVRHAKENMEK